MKAKARERERERERKREREKEKAKAREREREREGESQRERERVGEVYKHAYMCSFIYRTHREKEPAAHEYLSRRIVDLVAVQWKM